MILSVWRYSHLVLALCASLFLAMASITGAILAVDAIGERMSPYRVEDFNQINLSETLTVLRRVYPEITELTIDHNKFITLQAFDPKGNEVHAYIDPRTGCILGYPKKKSNFIQWVLAFHRSLFLHNTGRFFIGFSSFFLALVVVSGIFLVIQRQQGILKFFNRIVKADFAQYYHVVSGRLMLFPIFIIALSGTYLSLISLGLLSASKQQVSTILLSDPAGKKKDVSEFEVFKNTLLTDVQKVEFPFFEDPEEYYTLKLKDREIVIDQFTGNILNINDYPFTTLLKRISLNLHTGRTNVIWALMLAIASINILFFIYSGFTITLRRRAVGIKNKYKASESEFILLVGSENGSTLRFADTIHQQLLARQQTSFLTELNNYTTFPRAKHIIVFTATHGLGDPPSNAIKLISLIQKHEQKQAVNTAIVGFGSHAYPDFCGYAKEVESVLIDQPWAVPLLSLYTVNDKSPEQLASWVRAWGKKAAIPLAITPSLYNAKPANLQKMKVVDKTSVTDEEGIFTVTIRPRLKSSFTSGDLLAIYPANDERERLYSIGKHGNKIHLLVKFQPGGLGSGYLNKLTQGSIMKARIIRNTSFYFPKSASAVLMISNGTGIAPFLGMIDQNKQKTDVYLYGGFRKKSDFPREPRQFLNKKIQQNRLKKYSFSFSREDKSGYVMNAIQSDTGFVANILQRGGVVLLCGSLAMQRDVEATLDLICRKENGEKLSYYRSKGQLLTDCY